MLKPVLLNHSSPRVSIKQTPWGLSTKAREQEHTLSWGWRGCTCCTWGMSFIKQLKSIFWLGAAAHRHLPPLPRQGTKNHTNTELIYLPEYKMFHQFFKEIYWRHSPQHSFYRSVEMSAASLFSADITIGQLLWLPGWRLMPRRPRPRMGCPYTSVPFTRAIVPYTWGTPTMLAMVPQKRGGKLLMQNPSHMHRVHGSKSIWTDFPP